MNFFSSSGLAGLPTDVREFFAAVRLARPGALWLLLLLPLLGLLDRWVRARRLRAVSAIGRPAAVTGQFTHPRPKRRWFGVAYPIAWLLLIVWVWQCVLFTMVGHMMLAREGEWRLEVVLVAAEAVVGVRDRAVLGQRRAVAEHHPLAAMHDRAVVHA